MDALTSTCLFFSSLKQQNRLAIQEDYSKIIRSSSGSDSAKGSYEYPVDFTIQTEKAQ
jgi:hypothetical protein